MKLFKFSLSLILATGIFYALNTKLGDIPPLGKFLSPSQGFWQNEVTESNSPIESIAVDGFKAEVKVHYDETLIPHVFAQNDEDLYRAQGYLTAKHRLWQMEFQTHASAGRVAEIVGAKGIDYDRGQRRKGMEFGAENAMKEMLKYPEQQKLLEAYRDGVNAYIASLDESSLPIEYKLLDYKPEPWTIKKTALLLMYMTDMLAGGEADLENTNFIKLFGRETFDLLYPDFYEDQDPVIPQARDWSDFDVQKVEKPDGDFPTDFISQTMEKPNKFNGSNNWAVGPDKSASGNPILANDPHLQLNLPSIWYVMQLATPEKNTFGATLPGAMGIIVGFNKDIAWGVTNATRDVKDWYKIEFQDESRSAYKYDNEWRASSPRIENIKVRGQADVIDTVIYTHYGPVSYDHSFMGNNQKIGYAMKWAGHLPNNNQQTFLDLNKAKNYDEYAAALKHFTAPAQNFIFASREGDIALWIQGAFANKWPEQGKFLMDGANSKYEWQGFIPQAQNAHVKNPERNFVSSANQHPTDQSYPYYVYDDGYEAYRNRVINDFFRSKDKVTVQDFKDLHNNNYNLKAAELIPTMLAEMDRSSLSAKELEMLEIIGQWDFNNDIDAEGATIWERWWGNLYRMTWDELNIENVAMHRPDSYQTIQVLKNNPDHPFMDFKETPEIETASDLYLKSFKDAVEGLVAWQEKSGKSLAWEEYKATYVGHLLQALPAFSRFNLPIGGNGNIVNATSQNHGPSWRMIVELGEEPNALGVYPGGQSGNPGSKFYDNMVDTWAAGEYIQLLFMKTADQTSDGILFTQNLTPAQK
ncbi:MAG: penicillin acylase family protein [Cytophagales bacterium CG17_big_fil_post_rev_8_21_14_2_50_40_13]|nr:MAG: penicillin acylase family protein [Cytophagales bacterium CG17_big_fil_post_rev_8_21_14_2_50_40_13]